MRQIAFALTLLGLLVSQASIAQGASVSQVRLSVPASAAADESFALDLKLPAGIAAIDGRLLYDSKALELIGVATSGNGTAFAPVSITGGAAFGAYGLKAASTSTTLHLVVEPKVSGSVGVRLIVDAASSSNGQRVKLSAANLTAKLQIGSGGSSYSIPNSTGNAVPTRSAVATRSLVGAPTLMKQDIDAIRGAWEYSRLNGGACAAAQSLASDANNDGCIDIVDVQALLAGQSQAAASNPFVKPLAKPLDTLRQSQAARGQGLAPVTYNHTFTVTSTSDTPDNSPGDGVCADSLARCTLRAAITEANWSRGADLIQFNINAAAPVRINVGSVLPNLNDRTGGTWIDGYSQPGSRVNDAQYGSNAIPGVELVGTGSTPRTNIFRISSAGNVVRGFAMNTVYRAVVLVGADAHDNYLIGNWIGFTGTGANAIYNGDDNVYFDTAANNNYIGTPDLADRNVIGRSTKAIFLYGQGTDGNVIRNNVLCMTPSGGSAICSTGIDHDFGPSNGVIGGFGPNDKNVVGPTYLNGIEISHGWNPNHTSSALQYQNTGNQVLGNWIGFRIDGSYSASYRSAQNNPGNGDNGNAVNVYDGSSNNIVDGNWCASVYDGIVTATPNSSGNIIRNNIVGESPLGQAAPLARYGIRGRNATTDHFFLNNIVKNAGIYGIALSDDGIRRIKISQNIITDMTGQAIYLSPDPNNSASGANTLLASPVITSATTVTVSGTGINNATVELYRASRPAGQSGLPTAYLGSAVVASGHWSINVALSTGDRVTALQIAANNNTSMLGTNVAATFEAPPAAPVANFTWQQQSGNRTVNFTDTSTNTPTSWSWNFGGGGSSTTQNPTHTFASGATYQVALTATNAGGSDTRTLSVQVTDPVVGQYVVDTFGRNASNSWGSTNPGGAYTLNGTAADFNVANGAGTMNVPTAGAMRSALLNSATAQDVNLLVRVSVDKTPAGGAYFVYTVVRRNGTSEYRPKIRFRPDGLIAVQASRVVNNTETALGNEVLVSGLAPAPGTFVWLRAQVTGTNPTTISVKAWADGQAEPGGWQFTATDSAAELQTAGSTGLRAYIGGNVTTAPVKFTFDDFSVVAP